MNLMITKWLSVLVLEHKHNFHCIIIFELQCNESTKRQSGKTLFPVHFSALAMVIYELRSWKMAHLALMDCKSSARVSLGRGRKKQGH